MSKNATYGTDRGKSGVSTYTNEKGEEVEAPKRWTAAWLQSLSDSDLAAVDRLVDAETDYWSAWNFRTLHNRQQLVYRERKRRNPTA